MSDFRILTERLCRRKVFFSFDFDQDCSRAGIVRNSGVTKGALKDGYVDKADWEKVKTIVILP